MKKLVIANRGEISRRILKTARERGYLVSVISTKDDLDSLICKEVDNILIVSSFLNAKEIVNKSLEWNADFIHPGYGFLSENAEFAALVEKSGIIFVGPTPENMKLMGSKEAAKKIATKCSVPSLKALLSHDLKSLPESEWENELNKLGISSPFLVKASGGGGGRGMRIVHNAHELPNAIIRASDEAKAAFNDGTVFIERYLASPRHIEIQIFGDGNGGGVFFGERECSLQRRHQKVIEEAPAARITINQREKMGKASLSLVKETKYRGAGTLEFLMDEIGNFYFLEMNTRLQVEHPVTENVYGIDLVHAQFDLAEGHWPAIFPNPNKFHVLDPKCVSLEVRILAEDPRHDFLPTPGKVCVYREPTGKGIRVDSSVIEGARINPNFDSLIAKLIVSDSNRALAIKKLLFALENFVILGCTTNIPFLKSIVKHQDFLVSNESTNWISNNISELNRNFIPNSLLSIFQSSKFRENLSLLLINKTKINKINEIFIKQKSHLTEVNSSEEKHIFENFKIINSSKENKFYLKIKYSQKLFEELKEYSLTFSDDFQKIFITYDESIKLPFFAFRFSIEEMQISFFGEYLKLQCPMSTSEYSNKSELDSSEVRTPMAGKVFEVLVAEGQNVLFGQVLFIVESMKMQLEVKSTRNGKVTKIFVEQGQILSGQDIMAMVVLES